MLRPEALLDTQRPAKAPLIFRSLKSEHEINPVKCATTLSHITIKPDRFRVHFCSVGRVDDEQRGLPVHAAAGDDTAPPDAQRSAHIQRPEFIAIFETAIAFAQVAVAKTKKWRYSLLLDQRSRRL